MMIERSRLEPRQKFSEPQTENQEYGWISTPLFERSRDDRRFFFGKSECDITKFNAINLSKESDNKAVNK
ncbi:unnamed protein product [Hymenolepis diminuta]|uniref:Uncharacterized protein n=1 Tax=Hymenolepis diminuta TaxID=6216 RepID=A0A564YEF8_HYMDI|nr:unnamed protein product [Hymenolepis diminuta]